MPCRYRFITHSPGHAVYDVLAFQPAVTEVFLLLSVQQIAAGDVLVGCQEKPPVPQAGSKMVIIGPGFVASTIALMRGRGVKYCPAPPLTSSAFSPAGPRRFHP